MVDAKQVHAVVVAIEKYGLGPEWNLNGQADEAARFAAFLIDKWGLEASNVHVFSSPLGKDPFAAMGVDARGDATRENIEKYLSGEFLALKGEVLVFYWTGHGIATRELDRRLYFADAEETRKTALDVGQLIPLLRTSSFATQFGFLNACASFYEPMEQAAIVAGGLPTRQQPERICKQSYFFAALPGQYASGEDAFGPAIRKLLEQQPALEPDAEILWSGIRRELDERNLKTGFDQQPAWIEFNLNGAPRVAGSMPTLDAIQKAASRAKLPVYFLRELAVAALACPWMNDAKNRDRVDRKFYRPNKTDPGIDVMRIVAGYAENGNLPLLAEEIIEQENSDEAVEFRRHVERVPLINELAPLLAALKLRFEKALDCYRRVRPLRTEMPRSIEEILDDLLRTTTQGDPDLIEFLLRAAAASIKKPAAAAIQNWLDSKDWAGQASAIRGKLLDAQMPVRRFLVEVEDDGKVGRVWRISNDSCQRVTDFDFSTGGLADNIHRFIDRELAGGVLVLELLVPETMLVPVRGQFSVELRKRKVDPELKAGISLRWRDRMKGRHDSQFQFGAWQAAGNQVMKRFRSRGTFSTCWNNADADPDQVRQRILDEQGTDVVGIRSRDVDEILTIVCLSGASHGGWYRHDSESNQQQLEQCFCEMAGNCQIDRLQQEITSQRTGDKSHALHNLVLFWDDPAFNPLDQLTFQGLDQRT